jgi:hypothetical protein
MFAEEGCDTFPIIPWCLPYNLRKGKENVSQGSKAVLPQMFARWGCAPRGEQLLLGEGRSRLYEGYIYIYIEINMYDR